MEYFFNANFAVTEYLYHISSQLYESRTVTASAIPDEKKLSQNIVFATVSRYRLAIVSESRLELYESKAIVGMAPIQRDLCRDRVLIQYFYIYTYDGKLMERQQSSCTIRDVLYLLSEGTLGSSVEPVACSFRHGFLEHHRGTTL